MRTARLLHRSRDEWLPDLSIGGQADVWRENADDCRWHTIQHHALTDDVGRSTKALAPEIVPEGDDGSRAAFGVGGQESATQRRTNTERREETRCDVGGAKTHRLSPWRRKRHLPSTNCGELLVGARLIAYVGEIGIGENGATNLLGVPVGRIVRETHQPLRITKAEWPQQIGRAHV
jgi:hypothetical protein